MVSPLANQVGLIKTVTRKRKRKRRVDEGLQLGIERRQSPHTSVICTAYLP